MVSNFAKSPLLAVYFGALLYFSGMLIPYTEEYVTLSEGFVMPLMGNVYLIGFALWVCLTAALAFSFADRKSVIFIVLFFVSLLGAAWVVPSIESLLYGAGTGVLNTRDALFTAAARTGCTALTMLLFALIYKTAGHDGQGTDAESKPKTAPLPSESEVSYKLNVIQFVIRIIVLPLIYFVLYFVLWYFLYWSNLEVRTFYGGMPENPGFTGSIVNVMIDSSWMLSLVLIKGLAYTLFALPLMFMFRCKPVIFIALTAMVYLCGAAWLLVPTPLMPDTVRISALIFNSALLLAFGALSGALLHTAYDKKVLEPSHSEPQKAALTPQQQAAMRARRTASADKASASQEASGNGAAK